MEKTVELELMLAEQDPMTMNPSLLYRPPPPEAVQAILILLATVKPN